ncbi:isoprenylcysteine carboxyl methyltransferase family protein [Loktanella sp. DJP18]|uniref:isoprenylcysteine carboxyl methyltransferase family protein n=1 Tax=Loktanella sp. DJP18 TaxID=3409788 RepID=UPI003BB78294
MTTGTVLFLAFIVLQRLGELVIAHRNTARLMSRGAREVGAGHYPVMVAMHTAWLLALLVFGFHQTLHMGWLAVYAVLQVFRAWILGTLGARWTTRIIVLDAPIVTRGPFRFIRHPNYALVVAEIIVAPLVLGLIWVAVVFTVLNAAMLYHRIGVEDAALRNKGRHADGQARI